MVEKIAFYLDVNELAISEATVDNRLGAMHLLFVMEELYGLHPETVDNKLVLTIDDTLSSDIYEGLNHWLEYSLTMKLVKKSIETSNISILKLLLSILKTKKVIFNLYAI